jgi:hypothetical protein
MRLASQDSVIEFEQCRLEIIEGDRMLIVRRPEGSASLEEHWVPTDVAKFEKTNGDYGTLTVKKWWADKEEMT